MPLPILFPGADPTCTPATQNINRFGSGIEGGSLGQVLRPIEGVVIAFASNALTEQPLWIRLDDPGTI